MIIASYWLGSNESIIKTVNERLDVSADIEVIKPDYDLYVKALSEGKRVLIDVSLHVDSDKIDGRLLDVLKEEDALIVVDQKADNLDLATRNIPRVELISAENINPLSLIRHQNVLIDAEGIKKIESIFG